MRARLEVAEATIANLFSVGDYFVVTYNRSKVITCLDAAISPDPTTGTYGCINRATAGNEFWRTIDNDVQLTAANIVDEMNETWVQLCRGSDHPDLIIMGNEAFSFYLGHVQDLQRFGSS